MQGTNATDRHTWQKNIFTKEQTKPNGQTDPNATPSPLVRVITNNIVTDFRIRLMNAFTHPGPQTVISLNACSDEPHPHV